MEAVGGVVYSKTSLIFFTWKDSDRDTGKTKPLIYEGFSNNLWGRGVSEMAGDMNTIDDKKKFMMT